MADTERTEADAQADWDALDAEEAEGGSGSGLVDALTTKAVEEDQPAETFTGEEAEPVQSAQPAQPAPAAAPAEKPDPLKAINDEVAKLSRDLTASRAETRSLQGKIGGLTAELQRVKTEATVAKAVDVPGGPTAGEIAAAKESSAKWKALKEEFPAWGEGIENYVEEALATKIKPAPQVDVAKLIQEQLQEHLKSIPSQINAAFDQRKQQELETQRVVAEIDKVHPGWTGLVATQDFQAWRTKQAPGIQALANSSDVNDAITMLNLFRQAHPLPANASTKRGEDVQAQRQARLSRSAVPSRSVASGPRTAIAVDDMTPDQYWAYLDRQEAAAERRH
jgi:hypothetical protein